MEPDESIDLSTYHCEHCQETLWQEHGKLMCACFEVGLHELLIGYHQIPPFWVDQEPKMTKKDEDRIVPINDEYFSRFYAENAPQIPLEQADLLAQCKRLIEAPLNERQKRWYETAHELFSPNLRGFGRTYALMSALVLLALQNPNRAIYVIDHHPIQNPNNRHAVRSTLEGIIRLLPSEPRKRLHLSENGQTLIVEYRTR